MEKTKEAARQWIEDGKPCRYRYGLAYRGASSRPLTKEEALKLLPRYSFGMGFYELSFCQDRKVTFSPGCVSTEPYGDEVLMFNEYSENDLW